MKYKITDDDRIIVSKFNINDKLCITKDKVQNEILKLIDLNGKVSELSLELNHTTFIEEINCKNLKILKVYMSNIISDNKITKFTNTETVTEIYLYDNIGMKSRSEYNSILFKEFTNINIFHYSWWGNGYRTVETLRLDFTDEYKYNGLVIKEDKIYFHFDNDYEDIKIKTHGYKYYILKDIKEEFIHDGTLEIPDKYNEFYIENKDNLKFNKIIIGKNNEVSDLTKLNNYVIDEIIYKEKSDYILELNNTVKIKKINYDENEFIVPNCNINKIELINNKLSFKINNNSLDIFLRTQTQNLNLNLDQSFYDDNNKTITIPNYGYDYNIININTNYINDEIINLNLANAKFKKINLTNNKTKKLNIILPPLVKCSENQCININNFIVENLIIDNENTNILDNNSFKISLLKLLENSVNEILINSKYYLIRTYDISLIIDEKYNIFKTDHFIDFKSNNIEEKFSKAILDSMYADYFINKFNKNLDAYGLNDNQKLEIIKNIVDLVYSTNDEEEYNHLIKSKLLELTK